MKILLIANNFWNFYNFRNEIIKTLIKGNNEIYLIGSKDKYYDFYKIKNIKVTNINMFSRRVNIFIDIYLFLKLLINIYKINPNLVLCYTIKPNIYASIICRILKIDVINNITGLGSSFINGGVLKNITLLLYKIALKNSRLVFFHNSDDKKLFINRKIVNSNQSSVLPGSGVNLNNYTKKYNFEDQNIFLFIGRLLIDKGIHEFLQAADEITKENKTIIFKIIGEHLKNDSSYIEKNILNRYLNNQQIIYYGFQENIQNFLMEASCIVLPSYREGMSRSLIEAAAMSKPILASDVPGCRELVKNDYNGYTFEVKDVISLKETLKKFISLDIKKRNLMGRYSRSIVEKYFDEKIVINKYLKEINKIKN